MIQTWAIKAASHLARWILLRSHMQYAIEIGSNCNFQVSQGSVETYLRWGGKSLRLCVQKFLRDLVVKEFWKSVYICRCYDQKSSVLFFLDSQSILVAFNRWLSYLTIMVGRAMVDVVDKCLITYMYRRED